MINLKKMEGKKKDHHCSHGYNKLLQTSNDKTFLS